jgi:hypothetical protein
MLDMASVLKLMALATELGGAQRMGCRMTSHREPSRDRHHQTPIDAEAEMRAGWREHGILVVVEQDSSLTWSERKLVRQLGAKLYGQRRDMKR